MRLGFGATKKRFLQMAAIITVGMSASACSSLPDMPSVPDWVDPTTWFGDDSSTAGDSGQTPDLASLPDKPATSTPDEQRQVAESLNADRTNVKYSADALRGGTEPAAAPPPNAPVQAASESVSSVESKAANPQQAAAPAPVEQRTAQVDQSVVQAPEGAAMPGTLPSPGSATQVASVESPTPTTPVESATAPAPAPVQTAAISPTSAQPAVPAVPAVPQWTASVAPSDAALGFKPSSAPPLDPSISQFVAPPILERYQQTAANAGVASAGLAVSAVSAKPTKARRSHAVEVGEGGPETMSGAVVANLETLQPAPANAPSVYANPQGLPASAVVFFTGDSVYLNPEGRAQVRAAADQFKARGGQGVVRVVGHSSSRTPNMSLERHLEVIFRKSQERADAVAKELIRDGVPADKVLVDAVGDSQPVYYESMPKGEDGNRRAEIFVQG